MSTATVQRTTDGHVSGGLARIWNVVRLHVANPAPTLVVPWLITAAIFLITLAIWGIVTQAAGAGNIEEGAFTYNGGISWIFFFMTVVAIQAMNLTFRFALGFSVTRRDFYLGSALYFVLLSLMYATGFTVMAALETATNGWGVEGRFFSPFVLQDAPLVTVWFVFVMGIALFLFLGSAVATVWVRWRAYGLYAFFIGLAVVLVGGAWLVTTAARWPDVGRFFTENSLAALAAWTLPVTLVSALVGFFILRRATPRS